MPYKPKRPCSFPGCPMLIYGRYCREHQSKINKDYDCYKRDKVAEKFYKSKEWLILRKRKMSLNPICEHCELEGKVTPAVVVDHIVPIKKGGAKFDIFNLQSLCRYHDNHKGIRDRGLI